MTMNENEGEIKTNRKDEKILIEIEEWENIKISSMDTVELAIRKIAELNAKLK